MEISSNVNELGVVWLAYEFLHFLCPVVLASDDYICCQDKLCSLVEVTLCAPDFVFQSWGSGSLVKRTEWQNVLWSLVVRASMCSQWCVTGLGGTGAFLV